MKIKMKINLGNVGLVISSFFVISTNYSKAQTCTMAPANIVSWWSAEGNALDNVGGNNGNLGGNVTFGPGEVDQAFVFDGTNSFIDLGSPANLQLQDFTIECWIERSSSSVVSASYPNAQIFGYGQNGYALGIWHDGRLYLTKNDVDQVAVSAGLTDTNSWHHVAVTKSGSNVVFYLDGVGLPPVTYTEVFSFETSVSIGALGSTQICPFYGAIDELAVYSRALSASEIQTIYTAGSGGKCFSGGPFITKQPTNVAVPVGLNASFSVAASGTLPISYQWSFNGTNLPGATNYLLTLSNVQLSDSGNYMATVSNLSGFVSSSNAALTIILPPPCTTAPSNLVSWWSAEGNALDNAGGNNGILEGNTSFGTGEVGQSFVFDGSNSFVNVGNPANLQLQNFSIEAWIRRFSSSVVSVSYANGQIFGYGQNGYALGIWSDGRLYLTKNDVDQVAVSAGLTDTNSFHHVAVTKSGSVVTFYLDGAAFPSVSYGDVFSFTTPALIGASDLNSVACFEGAIDELAVYSRALSSNEVQSIYNAGRGGKCAMQLPPSIYMQPSNQTISFGGQATFTVAATGSPTLGFQWSINGSALAGATNSSLTLTNVTPAQSNIYAVKVTNSFGSVLSSNATLTVNPVVQLVNSTASGGTVTVPVNLLASGNENALQFSVAFNSSLLTFTGATLGSNANSGFLSVNTNQLPSGRLGIDVFLPFGSTFSPGTQQVAQVTFKTAPLTNSTTTPISFGDLPTVRQVSNPQAMTIPATYVNGTVSLPFLGYEGDVAPRTNGDGSLTLTDWLQEGRFVAGLDTPTNTSEFLRADCAPRATLGDGYLTVADWVQVWRYATGMDAATQGGGPTQSAGTETPNPSASRTLTISNSTVQAGQSCQVSVLLNSQGNENALGFSVAFDPSRLNFVSVLPGNSTTNAEFIANTNQAAVGNIGIVLEMPSLSSINIGTQEVARLSFSVSPYASKSTTLAFTNQPVLQDTADGNAARLPTSYFNGVLAINNSILLLGEQRKTNGLILSWPASLSGFHLESNSNLLTTNWVPVVTGLTTNGGTITTSNLPTGASKMFYRLHHP
jgi:Concanavalin A-like lectin/glucanases superfamily/Immunoglobulin I-set domain/Immunoglobulin domain/Cohesin domain